MPWGLIILLIIALVRFIVKSSDGSSKNDVVEEYKDSEECQYVYPKLYEEDVATEPEPEETDGTQAIAEVSVENTNELDAKPVLDGEQVGNYLIKLKPIKEEFMEKEKIVNYLKAHFESEGYKYDEKYDLEDDVIIITTGFRGDSLEKGFAIKLVADNECYRIIGLPKDYIPMAYIPFCYKAINDWNRQRKVKMWVDDEDGQMVLEVLHPSGGLVASEDVIAEFDLVCHSIQIGVPQVFQSVYACADKVIRESGSKTKKKFWFRK